MTSHRVAHCFAGGREYFIDLGGVASIQQSNVVERLPSADAPRGQLQTAQGTIPVYSLAHLLTGESPVNPARSYCLVASDQGRRWGLMVDQIQRATDLPADRVLPLPDEFRSDWCRGVVQSLHEPQPTRDEHAAVADAASVDLAAQLTLLLDPRAIDGDSACQPTVASDHPPTARATSLAPQTAPDHRAIAARRLVLLDLPDSKTTASRMCVAFHSAQVAEITGRLPVTLLPRPPRGVVGLIRWRQHAVPLLNLAESLGFPGDGRTDQTRIAVVSRPQRRDWLAFLVPATVRMQSLADIASRARTDLTDDSPALLAAFDVGDQTLLFPDLDQLLHVGRVLI